MLRVTVPRKLRIPGPEGYSDDEDDELSDDSDMEPEPEPESEPEPEPEPGPVVATHTYHVGQQIEYRTYRAQAIPITS